MKTRIPLLLCVAAVVALSPATQGMSLDVNQCRRLALETDQSVTMADNDVRGAELDRQVARTNYLPNLSGSATGVYCLPDNDANGMSMRLHGVWMAGLSVTQPIYAGGKIVAANRLADVSLRIAREQRRKTRMDVLADADNAYWSYVAVLAKVRMVQAYLAQIDTVYAQTQVALEAGMLTQNDLLRIDARRSQVTYQLQQATSGADLCRMALCRTIGVELDTPLEVADMEVAVEEVPDLGEYDLAQRPEMQMLAQQVQARTQQMKMTRADFLPTLGLQVGWSAYGNAKIKGTAEGPDGQMHPYTQEIKGNGWTGFLSLKVPLFHWGEGIKKVRRAKVDIDNARLSLERNRRMMDLEVNQAIQNVMTGRVLITTAATALRQADESLRNMADRYDVGMSTLTDMLDAQAQWQTSYANLIEARAQYSIYVTEYRRVTGKLDVGQP